MTIRLAVKILMFGSLSLLLTSCNLRRTEKAEQVDKSNSSELMKNWQDQKFSMFIHWGIYSIPAGVWNGENIQGYSEQIKGHARIPSEDYRKLTADFNPDKWNADSVALLAKESGMKSIIITSKHHDGFCMFESEFTEFDVVDATPYKKDVLKELSDACIRHGLKFGVYFSLIDWDYHGALPFTSVNNSDSIPPLHHEYNLNQIRELLSNYGDISEFWFDMGAPTFEQSKEMADLIKEMQPNCLVSGRIWNDQGDFVVMGDNYTPDFKMGVPWQTPASIFHETWSYRSWQERPSVEEKVKEKIGDLINIVSSGGNYLLNIGPKADGMVISFEKHVLLGVGDWLSNNGEAIYGTNVSSIVKQDWGCITTKNNKLYLHVFKFPENNILSIDGLMTSIKKAYPLSNADLSLENSTTDKGLEIYLTDKMNKDKYATVIVLEYDDELEYAPSSLIIPNEDNAFILSLDNAEKYHSYSGHDYYSSKPTIVKLKWYLSANTNDACEIDILSSEQIIKPLKLSINNKEYLLPSENSDDSLKKGFIKQAIKNLDFYSDRINEIELSFEDKSNPHKGLNIEEIVIKIN